MASLRHGLPSRVTTSRRHRRLVPTRALASFAGLGQASTLAVPLGRCWLRSVYDDIAEQGQLWSGRTRLSRQSLADLREWTRLRDSRHVGRSIWLLPEEGGEMPAGSTRRRKRLLI